MPISTTDPRGASLAPVAAFFVLAYGIAWGMWLVVAATAGDSGVGTDDFIRMVEAQQFEGVSPALPEWLLYLMTRVIDFSFSIAGILIIAATFGRDGLRELGARLVRWRFGARWYLLAVLPAGLFAAATILAGAASSFQVEALGTALFSLQAGLLVSLLLRGAMGEELGLRGFALPQLQARMSPFQASLLIGVLWGLWHLPVLLSRGPVSIVLFLILAVGLSCLFTLMFNGSGGSLIPGLLFHAIQNWEEGFESFFPVLVGTDWELPSTVALIAIGVGAGVIVHRRGAHDARAATAVRAA
jgi:membrane protease YdiL (CAAX protease family)